MYQFVSSCANFYCRVCFIQYYPYYYGRNIDRYAIERSVLPDQLAYDISAGYRLKSAADQCTIDSPLTRPLPNSNTEVHLEYATLQYKNSLYHYQHLLDLCAHHYSYHKLFAANSAVCTRTACAAGI